MPMRIYRWDNAGAPVLTGLAGGFAIINVLDACLVNGYGARAAAGWTKEFTGTGKAVYKQGAGSNGMRLRVDCSASSKNPRVRGYETMTDVDTGAGLFPVDGQVSGGLFANTSATTDATARPWLVAADEKRFYLYCGRSETTAVGLASAAWADNVFFGDIHSFRPADAFNTMLIASVSADTPHFGNVGSIGAAQIAHYMARSFTQSGTSITAGKMRDSLRAGMSNSIGAGGGSAFPDPVSGGLLLAPVFVNEPAAVVTRGRLPGLWAPLHSLPGVPGDTFSGSGDLAGRTFILLAAGHQGGNICRIAIETSDTW